MTTTDNKGNTEIKELPQRTPVKDVPSANVQIKEVKPREIIEKTLPSSDMQTKQEPIIGQKENIVFVKGSPIEIKPTKLKYHRNRTALFYRVLDNIPLPELLAAEEGVFDKDRDGDKCVMDWLIAVFDNPKFVEKNYNEFDSSTIYRCLEIFKRLNGIKDIEEKNMKAKETKA